MDLAQSRKVASRILINNKMQQFKKQLEYSQKRFKHKSAHVRLADKMYSQAKTPKKKQKKNSKSKNNKSSVHKTSSPLKNKRLNSNSKGSLSSRSSSRQFSDSKLVMKGLQSRTHCLSELVNKNSSLLLEKKQLQQRIAFYRQQIALEKRRYNQSEVRSKLHQESIKDQYQRLHKKQKQRLQLKQQIESQLQQSQTLQSQMQKKKAEKNTILLKIQSIRKWIKKDKKMIKQQQNTVRKVEVEKVEIKNTLRESQKRLANQIVEKQELSDQKAYLMIQANLISKRIQHLS